MKYSLVTYSALEKTSTRLDPEYYHPYNLKLLKKLQSIPNQMIGNFSYVTDGIHESIKFDENSDINLISAKIPKDNYFDLSRCNHISILQDKKNPRTRLHKNDVIISTVGTIGNCAVVDEAILPANSDRHVGIIRIKKDFYPHFLSTFLLSKYGRFQTLRESTGNVQLNLFIYKIKEILVPKLTSHFQLLIENVCLKAKSFNLKANNNYSQAEQMLLSELNLLNWKPKHKLTYVKSYSAAKVSGRIDAEYFQPKYNEIVKAIKNHQDGFDTLGNLASIKKCIEVGSIEYLGKGVPFIRVSNISPFEIKNEKCLSKELYSKLISHQPKKGEILLSKDASPGIAYFLNENPVKMIPSGGILRIKTKNTKIISEYLFLVLNSLIVKEQINRDVGGSVILHWRPDQVKNTLIPILKNNKQEIIKDNITKSTEFRQKSKALLEIAKKGVELAIEKDEIITEKWMRSEIAKIEVNINI
jgi:restriction endonuclease S subunit